MNAEDPANWLRELIGETNARSTLKGQISNTIFSQSINSYQSRLTIGLKKSVISCPVSPLLPKLPIGFGV